MLSNMGTPRPLPPAKARKANAAMQALLKTPPPAYGTPFTFPEHRQRSHSILGSPMVSTYQMVGWPGDYESIEDAELPIADEVVTEKSREELKELLVKAGQIIKQRENELGVTSAVCKGLHSNNIALKSKHEALLARLPGTPPRSTSSPAHLYHQATSREGSISVPTSLSDSAIDVTGSPEIPYHHARKVSIATADISLLADQNAELLDKLEKLEMEATHADHVGRRELKRLEKEIEFLHEALEKTQERSEELENKVQGAMANEAWRRKKEREAKFRAMRNLGRDDASSSTEIRNFAPEGSNFGGPSQAFRLLSATENSDPYDSLDDTSSENGPNSIFGQLTSPQHNIIAQLLTKVKELEETNTRILQQQSETADQLSAVQRDTAHITQVYDSLADPHYAQLEFNHNSLQDEFERGPYPTRVASGQTTRFVSLSRYIEDDMDVSGTRVVHPRPDVMFSSTKHRKSVVGLFDEHARANNRRRGNEEEMSPESDARLRKYKSLSSWDAGDNYSSWSSHPDMDNMPQRRSLSPLHFFSPPSQHVADLSPVETRATLQHELMREFGEGASWEAAANAGRNSAGRELHLRTSSLYDLSQLSVPPSPSPPQREVSHHGSEELDFEAIRNVSEDVDIANMPDGIHASAPSAGLLMPMNILQLSVEPPTPEKRRTADYTRSGGYDAVDRHRTAATSSPRVQKMTEVLRAREERWSLDRRLRPRTSFLYESGDVGRLPFDKEKRLTNLRELDDKTESDFSPFGGSGNNLTVNLTQSDPSNGASLQQSSVPRRLMDAVDSMIDGFAGSAADIRDAIVLNYDDQDGVAPDEKDEDDSDNDSAREVYHSAPVTPELRARSLRHRRSELSNTSPPGQFDLGDEDDMLLHPRSAAAPPQKATERVSSEGGLMLRVWLWIQFAIVVFVFLYAMARRGPAVVLTDGDNKRGAVARRRQA